jgi:hypothetical protein
VRKNSSLKAWLSGTSSYNATACTALQLPSESSIEPAFWCASRRGNKYMRALPSTPLLFAAWWSLGAHDGGRPARLYRTSSSSCASALLLHRFHCDLGALGWAFHDTHSHKLVCFIALQSGFAVDCRGRFRVAANPAERCHFRTSGSIDQMGIGISDRLAMLTWQNCLLAQLYFYGPECRSFLHVKYERNYMKSTLSISNNLSFWLNLDTFLLLCIYT